MPAKSISIIWTALPAGVPEHGKVLRLSIHVSPRLMTDEGGARPRLEQFADYFADWPEVVRNLRFNVRFNPGPTVEAERVGEPSSEFWQALFPLDTYIRPYEFPNYDDRLIFSYPVGNVLSHIEGIYQRTAQTSPEQFPSRDNLRRDRALAAIRFVHDAKEAREIDAALGQQMGPTPSPQALREQLVRRMQEPGEGKRRGVRNALPPGPPDPTLDFFQVTNFFTPQSTVKPDREVVDKWGQKGKVTGEYERLPAVIPVPDIDFHQIVSTLAQYPKLLRDLGLVIDLDVPLEGGIVGEAAAPDLPTVQIIPIWPGGAPAPLPEAVLPKTVYILDGERFVAKPQPDDPDLSEHGLLRLDKEGYALVQVDVDGAALKAMGYSYNLHRSIIHRSADSDLESSLPALRSIGFALARTGNALRLATKLQVMAERQTNLPADPTPVLYAEDLLRGYRVDVWDNGTRQWRSLHQRVGEYACDAGPERSYQDEGFTQIAVTSSADETSPDLFLHEIFANWEGWSLSAPKPGAWLTDESNSERKRERAHTELDMETTFSALPGSLPRLRFGTSYRLRVRGVDLAGNSPAFKALVPETLPLLLNPVDEDDPAASDERPYYRFEPLPPPVTVLRTDIVDSPGESLERVVIRSFNDEPAKDEQITHEVSDRHLAPPKGPWSLAEAHGMLDLPPSQAEDPEKLRDLYAVIVRKDGNFPATKPTPTKQEAGAANPIYDGDAISELPYLPDPIGRGASLLNLPGVPTGKSYLMTADGFTQISDLLPAGTRLSLGKVAFRPGPGDAWFEVGAFRIRLEDGTGRSDLRPRWDGDDRLLTVYLPKAEVAEVPYSCFLGEDDLDLMGIWHWIVKATPKEADLEFLKQLALDGRHWMLTPRRTLVLVHAVQQPLRPPAFSDLTPQRSLGNTFATLIDRVRVHAKSTVKLDVRAEWSEWIDALAEPEPRRITGSAHVCELGVDDPEQDILNLAHRHEFGDTKYRKVRYRGTATTRFREYLPAGLLEDEQNITRTTIDVPEGADEEPFISPVIDVPNAARPEAPRLLYVVPAFRWEEETGIAGPPLSSRREGGWLRVYLDRPWYSSGDRELLGTLIWTDEFRRIPTEYRPYVTQWGTDPIWVSAPTTGAASLAAFKAATETKLGGLTLDELTPPLAIAPVLPTLRRLEVLHPTPRSQTQVAPQIERAAGPEVRRPAVELRRERPVVARQPETVVAEVRPVPTLAVAGHEVRYDPERRLWYADIHIDAGPSYFPFVRLALVRFQPISLPNAHVSRVVLADFAQLTPDRAVSLGFDPKRPQEVALTVNGLTYQRSEAMREPGQIFVRVETLRTDVPEELGWVPVRDVEIEEEKVRRRGEVPLWSGKITLPVARGTRPFRLVIQEFEGYAYQPAAAQARMARVTRAGRLVYAHAIEL